MKHFAEARSEIRQFLLAAPTRQGIARACAVWDLEGRIRLFVEADDAKAAPELRKRLEAGLASAAEGFWSGALWISSEARSIAEKHVFEEAWTGGRELEPAVPEIRELERHLSKESWFGLSAAPPWPLEGTAPPILSFFSFKGGVGRTTAAASFAIQLARAKRRVTIIDLDLEAPGLGVLFSTAAARSLHGVVDYLLERTKYKGTSLVLEDYTFQCADPAIIGLDGVPITVMPAGELDALYIEKLARIDYARLVAGAEGEPPLASLLRQFKRESDYILIDSRAGIHDIGGLALNGLAHFDVLVSLDTEQGWEGLRLVVRHLGRERLERGAKQQDCGVVFGMAPGALTSERPPAATAFRNRAYDLFTTEYYEPAGDPEANWPVPDVASDDKPHHPAVVGFNTDLLRPRSLAAAADVLTQGDYKDLTEWLLRRLGRTEP